MKQMKKLLGIILVLCLLASVVPAVYAAETEEAATYGPVIGVGSSAVQIDGTLIFGSEEKWFVMDGGYTTVGTKGLALLCSQIVDANIPFAQGGLDNSWANSDAKAWNTEFAAKAFSDAELAAILDTTKAEEAGSFFGGNWSSDALSGEKLFFLSAGEVEDYFADGINGLIASAEDVVDGWWLRSANADRNISSGIVSDAGFVGSAHVAATWGARPAFNIASDKIILSSAAVNGKVSGTVGADCLTAVADASSNEWKLTVADEAHSAFAATIADGSGKIEQGIDYTSWQIPVSYSGAVAGENEYVSVVICNNVGEAVYYGHIAQNAPAGTVDVNMPVGLSGKYTISVFAEKINGDHATDFGSPLVSAEIEIVDGLGKVDTWGLTLEGDIRADFMMDLSDVVASDPDAYVSVTIDGVETQNKISDITPENGLYRIVTNVAAAQMTENINIQIMTSDKSGSELVYSVQKYGNYILENSDDQKMNDLVKAMLNYGGKAQGYFDYNLGNKADNGISVSGISIPYTEGLAAKKAGSSENVKFYGASLIHENQTGIRFYFTSTDGKKPTVTFSTAGNEDMPVYEGKNMYYVEVLNIPPHNLCDDITISVDGLSVTYSPFYYMHRQYYKSSANASLRELMLAMYSYYHYAAAYLSNG